MVANGVDDRVATYDNGAGYTLTVPRTPELDAVTEYLNRYRATMMDQMAANIYNVEAPVDAPGGTYNDIDRTRTPVWPTLNRPAEFNIPPGATLTGIEWHPPNEFRPRYIEGTDIIYPQPPNINDRLCAKVISANGSRPTLRLIQEAYIESIVPHRMIDPDQMWIGGPERWLWTEVRDLIITNIPMLINQAGQLVDSIRFLNSIRFREAILLHDPSLPPNEIFITHSEYREIGCRIIDLYVDNPIWQPVNMNEEDNGPR